MDIISWLSQSVFPIQIILKHPSVSWVVRDALRWPNLFAFQTVAHEDCEKVVVPNNLCFGKCGSIHFPGAETHPYNFCSHCSPTKLTTMHLRLNCTSPRPVVKVVTQVEECQCVTKTEHGEEHFLAAGSHESFIPGLSAPKAIPRLPLKTKPQQKKWGLLNLETLSGCIKGKLSPPAFFHLCLDGVLCILGLKCYMARDDNLKLQIHFLSVGISGIHCNTSLSEGFLRGFCILWCCLWDLGNILILLSGFCHRCGKQLAWRPIFFLSFLYSPHEVFTVGYLTLKKEYWGYF